MIVSGVGWLNKIPKIVTVQAVMFKSCSSRQWVDAGARTWYLGPVRSAVPGVACRVNTYPHATEFLRMLVLLSCNIHFPPQYNPS